MMSRPGGHCVKAQGQDVKAQARGKVTRLRGMVFQERGQQQNQTRILLQDNFVGTPSFKQVSHLSFVCLFMP